MTTRPAARASSLLRLFVVGAVLAWSGLLSLAGAPAALAHDALESSSPSDGEQVPRAPEELVLTFTGEISDLGTLVEVTGPDGDVTGGTPRTEGTDVVQPLAPDLPAGEYQVAWRVTSSDGHPISGDFAFGVVGGEPDSEDGSGSASPTSEAPAQSTASASSAPPAAEAGHGGAHGSGDQGSGPPAWVWVAAAAVLAGAAALALRARRR